VGGKAEIFFETSLDKHISGGLIIVVVDKVGGLVGEWSDTCGWDTIQVLISHWEYLKGFKYTKPAKNIGRRVSKLLRLAGFSDGIDRLIVRIALATIDRTVISDESDFWEPKEPDNRKHKGDPNSPVARLLCEELGIKVLLLGSLLASLKK
jgi:hypothetical protein